MRSCMSATSSKILRITITATGTSQARAMDTMLMRPLRSRAKLLRRSKYFPVNRLAALPSRSTRNLLTDRPTTPPSPTTFAPILKKPSPGLPALTTRCRKTSASPNPTNPRRKTLRRNIIRRSIARRPVTAHVVIVVQNAEPTGPTIVARNAVAIVAHAPTVPSLAAVEAALAVDVDAAAAEDATSARADAIFPPPSMLRRREANAVQTVVMTAARIAVQTAVMIAADVVIPTAAATKIADHVVTLTIALPNLRARRAPRIPPKRPSFFPANRSQNIAANRRSNHQLR